MRFVPIKNDHQQTSGTVQVGEGAAGLSVDGLDGQMTCSDLLKHHPQDEGVSKDGSPSCAVARRVLGCIKWPLN